MLLLRIALALGITFIIEVASQRLLAVDPPRLLMVAVYLLIYILLGSVLQRQRAADEIPPHPRIEQIPLPEPARAMTLLYYFSAFASSLNPFQLVQQFAQLGGQISASRRYDTPLTAETYAHQTRFTLPFRGEWLVMGGGVTPATSHSWDIITQRYAYDFVKTADATLQRHTGDGRELAQYACYGEPIIAAADGEVVVVRDGIRDWPLPGLGLVDFLCRDFRGNHIIVRHTDQEYTLYAHLIPGSIPVQVGERVERGTELGKCGNSGHSTEPHLHFHLQDTDDFFTGVGLPVRFSDITVEGEVTDSWLQAGMFVFHA